MSDPNEKPIVVREVERLRVRPKRRERASPVTPRPTRQGKGMQLGLTIDHPTVITMTAIVAAVYYLLH